MTNMTKPPISSTRLFLLSSILIGTCSALQRQSVHRKPALSFSPQPWGVVQSSSTDDDPTNDDHVILLDLHDAAAVDATSVLQKDDSSSLRLADKQQQSKGPQIVLMGAPSSGKGTQSERIVQQYNVVHLSTGDMLRQAVQQQQQQQDSSSSANNSIGAIAKAYMDRGELVPDDIMTQLVLHRISQPDCIEKGWILDGFPRTRGQAEAMKEFGIVPDKIILLEVPDALLLERVVGRRLDPVTGKIYHLTFFPPKDDSIRDRLVQRSDDTVESMVNRLRSFHANVDAIREFYDNEVLVKVNGAGTPDEIAKSVFGAIDKRRRQVLATTK